MNTAMTASGEAKGGHVMSIGVKNLKFWGQMWLESMGISLGAAAVMIFLFGIGESDFGTGGIVKMILNELTLFPYYVMICGTFVMLMVTISCFQLYCPLLVSMNVTRKMVIASMLLENVCMIAGITAVSGILWICLPGDAALDGLRLLPLLTGIMFAVGGITMVLGVVITKWGKIGMMILIVIGMTVGAFAGVLFAVGGQDAFEWLRKLYFNFYYVLGIGILMYAAAGVFTVFCMRKLEVRA